MKKLKLNKETVSILGKEGKKQIGGGDTSGGQMTNCCPQSTQCTYTLDKCSRDLTDCDQGTCNRDTF